AGDAAGQVQVEQKVLAERLAGGEAVPGDDLAQGRQRVEAGPAHPGDLPARRAARRSASIRLRGLAVPLPASGSAVPWSGEVRTKGRPSVTFTPSSKARVLTGI